MAKGLLEWSVEKASYARMARAILGRDTRVLDGDPRIAPGYASEKGDIYITQEDSLWKDYSPIEKIAYRKGIFTHELCHQVFTNFKKTSFVLKGMPARERKIFSTLSNILEDPAIEYLAPTVIGGPMLDALNFAIANTYRDSPNVEESTTPFTQYISAMIQYGDMGLLKGHFTFEEAKRVFLDTADLFYQGIIEPNSGKRVDIAKELHEKTRILWEPELKKDEEAVEAFLSMLKDLLDSFGKSEATGTGEGSTPSTEGLSENKKKSERRKNTVIKVSKEVFDALSSMSSENDSSNSSSDSGDGITIECEDEEAQGKNKGKGSGSGDEKEDKKGNGEESGENGNDEGKEGKSSEKSSKKASDSSSNPDSKSSSSKNESNSESSENSSKNVSRKPYNSDSSVKSEAHREAPKDNDPCKIDLSGHSESPTNIDGDGVIDEEEYKLTEADKEYIKKEAQRLQDEYETNINSERDDTSVEDFDIETPSLKGLSCLNNVITSERDEDLSSSYLDIVKKSEANIRSTIALLKKIFEQDYEDRVHKQTGRINVNRLNSGRVTSRIFDKINAPTGKRDVAVAILVDESGSMSGSRKYSAAKESCIALTEIFSRLEIPIYVMGFTADEQGHDIVHNHYVRWKNSPLQRLSLLNISARSNNCDGYSIRYITQILKKRKETHKLLIVLSDGQPAARAYGYGGDGVADTKAAIREAKKHAHVLGVAIGNSDTDTIQSMYEKNFLHISQVQDLFVGLSRELRKMFKNI